MRNTYEEDIRRWRKAEEALKKANVPPPYEAIICREDK